MAAEAGAGEAAAAAAEANGTEKSRNRNRSIIHLDADAFFASVEQAADPRLRGRPVAVGGESRGVIAAASYEARQFGIFTTMPTARARKLCPQLIVLPGDFDKYEQFSRWMFSYAYDFTPEVEITSVDEGYFDVTAYRRLRAREVAEKIRGAIGQSLKIRVSEGIATSKLISQIASKLNKPRSFTEVPSGWEKRFIHPLPSKWLPGVGEKTGARFIDAGLSLIRHVSEVPVEFLEMVAGSAAPALKRYSDGVDDRPVIAASEPARSYSQQETFAEDIIDENFALAVLKRMADSLMAKIRGEGRSIRCVAVRVRYNDMDEDQCSATLNEPTDLETDLYGRIESLLRRAWRRRVSLRLVSLRLSQVYDGYCRTSLPFGGGWEDVEARRRLVRAVDSLRGSIGRAAVVRGHDLVLRDSPAHPVPSKPPPPPPPPEPPTDCGGSARSAGEGGRPASRTLPVMESGRAVMDTVRHRTPPVTTWVPLAVHSYYSMLDSTLTVDFIAEWAAGENLPAVALTDTANLHGAWEFSEACRRRGIRPVLGSKVFMDGAPVYLYVMNRQGYGNLCRLLSPDPGRGAADDPAADPSMDPLQHYRLHVTRDELHAWGDGLIAVGRDPVLSDIFPGRFYQPVTTRADWKQWQLEPSGRGFPRVAILPAHYAVPEDRLKYNILQAVRTGTLVSQKHPAKNLRGNFHLRNFAEVSGLFGLRPDFLHHTLEIADRCRFEVEGGRPQFPSFVPPDGSSAREFLERLVMEGLKRRYGRRRRHHEPQVREELHIIGEVGYEEYFLIVWDILQECRRRGIEWITRGSAADSLVCYTLGISDVCPVRFELYFRRFLNKERMALNKLPDIDVDFPHDRKDEVIRIIFEKYGFGQTAVVGGFSTFRARSAVADIAKTLGVSEFQVRRLTGRFPHARANSALETILRKNYETGDLPYDEDPYATAVAMAAFLDGFPRYPKMHPCGVVLSRGAMHDLTPTFISGKGFPTTHFDMDSVEPVGLIKIDILAQGGLAVMRDARQWLSQRGIDVDLKSLDPWEDRKVWAMIRDGGSRAVHHIESPAMVSLCRMTQVREIHGLVAIVSVIRPGAANESKKLRFTRRYQGLEPVRYPHPSLESCLRSTFGLVVYEEHILQICEAYAGLDPGKADILRRALGKEKEETIEAIRQEFFEAARLLGRPERTTREVWDLVAGFAGYAFCKAHSTAYAVEAYEGAWLKCYYPAEFMAAVLSNGKGFYNALVYILECLRLGIRILAPAVNDPGPAFVPDGRRRTIRVPLTRINGLKQKTLDRLMEERRQRPFESLEDFYWRVSPPVEDMEKLIRVGAFDEFGDPRTRQFWRLQEAVRTFDAGSGAGWLIPPPATSDGLRRVALTEPDFQKCLEAEYDLLGFTVSGHPLEMYPGIDWDSYCPVARLGDFAGREVVACGLVIEQRIHHQMTGEPMKFMTLCDWTGMVETELFARTYRSFALTTIRYPVLEVHATVEPYENRRGFSLRVHRVSKPRKRKLSP